MKSDMLNRGTTVAGQKRVKKMSEAYASARANKAIPKPGLLKIEAYEEAILVQSKPKKRESPRRATTEA
jgi:hypothetical protein